MRFEDWEAQQMQDPGFRYAAAKLEPLYQRTVQHYKMGKRQLAMKARVWLILEWIDFRLLRCRVVPFCTWLLYSAYWDESRD